MRFWRKACKIEREVRGESRTQAGRAGLVSPDIGVFVATVTDRSLVERRQWKVFLAEMIIVDLENLLTSTPM